MALNTATRAKAAFLVLIAAWGYAAWPMLFSMFKSFAKSGYDYHGFLALPVFLALLQQQRSALNRIKLSINPLYLVGLLLCAALWIFADLTTLTLLEQVALISMIPAIMLTTYGRKFTSTLAYPLLTLFLLLPFGAPLYNALQQIISSALLHCLAFAKVAIYWENNKILIGKQEYALDTVCSALRYSSIFVTFGICVAGYFCKNFFLRLLVAFNFIFVPVLTLFTTTAVLILLSSWQNLANFKPIVINILSWSTISIGLIIATYCAYKLRSKNKHVYRNDGIDWRNDFARSNGWLTATSLATVLLCALPFTADYLKGRQHYANNWHDPQTIVNSKNVTLSIKYDKSAKTAQNKSTEWQQIKHKKITVAVNGKNIPINETISISKYQGKITWDMDYTNGHLTNNKIYSKVLENMYALTKPGAKTAAISLTADLNSNLQNSRATLTKALGELQKTASTTWLRG